MRGISTRPARTVIPPLSRAITFNTPISRSPAVPNCLNRDPPLKQTYPPRKPRAFGRHPYCHDTTLVPLLSFNTISSTHLWTHGSKGVTPDFNYSMLILRPI